MSRGQRLLTLGALLLIGLVWAGYCSLHAQGPGPAAEKPPELSEVDRLKVINALQLVELWSLKTQAAAAELGKARETADKLIQGLQQPGWQLTDQLQYVKTPKKP